MRRRTFVRNSVIGGVGIAAAQVIAAKETSVRSSVATTPDAFELDELTIADLQSGMTSGQYTAHSLTEKYLERISEIDKQGPTINAVIETNPEALAIASELD